jgi:hypothetical protein
VPEFSNRVLYSFPFALYYFLIANKIKIRYSILMPKTNDPHDLFDLVFKRLMHLSSVAIVSFINGLFGTNHPLTSIVEYFETESVSSKLKKNCKDMVIGINGKRYIIELQRRNDKTMALRIFIYSYSDALNTQSADENGVIILDFPQAAVIYLENTGKTNETLRFRFPDNIEHTYTVPVFNLLEYSIADIEKQNLQLLLPFYVLKLHDKVKQAKSGDERQRLTPELITLLKEIERAIDQAVTADTLNDEDTKIIIELLDRVYNNLYKSYNELQEANKMAEQFLELRVEKAAQEAWQKARQVMQEAEQKAAREKQAIADFLRANGTPDDLISRAFNIQAK